MDERTGRKMDEIIGRNLDERTGKKMEETWEEDGIELVGRWLRGL